MARSMAVRNKTKYKVNEKKSGWGDILKAGKLGAKIKIKKFVLKKKWGR